MQTIELECPQCKTMLELDGGFAGGVCRCSSCGTLMTVPSDPSRERAETLTRPESPGASRPEAPTSGGRPDTPGGRPSVPEQNPTSPEPAAAASSGDTETFVTASGKKVRVSKKMTVPMAKRKRKAIRAGVIAVFVLFAVFIGAGVISAVVVLTRPPGPEGQIEELTGPRIEIQSNPFLEKKPNFLGLPLLKKAVVTIDASSSSRSWLSLASEGFYAGTGKMPPDASAQIIFWREGGFSSFPSESPRGISSDADRKELRAFIESVSARGSAEATLSIEKAFGAKPNQVIIMTGKMLDDAETAKLRELMKANPGVKVDFAVVGGQPPGLEELLKEGNGQFIEVSPTRLQSWYGEAQDKAGAAADTTGGGTTGGKP